jgi:hypothetical protein
MLFGSSGQAIKIVYIVGYGRSGTTLADILIGNLDGHFSTGELSFFAKNGIVDNEYCACGSRVNHCPFWNKVIKEWDSKRKLKIEDYIAYNYSYFRNKRIIPFFYKLLLPDNRFQLFLEDTKVLYEIIYELNGNRTIVDSSKSPYRLWMLRKLGFEIKVVHIVRRIRGVLFSTGKMLNVDPESGIEKEIKPRNQWHVIFTWTFANLLAVLFSKGIKRIVVRFEEMVHRPMGALNVIKPVTQGEVRTYLNFGPFTPGHIVAGGRMRMQKEVWIKQSTAEDEVWKGSGLKEWVVSFLDRIRWSHN